MRVSGKLAWCIVFLVSMIVFSTIITPLTVQVEYYYPCREPSEIKDILPLTCGSETKVVFRLKDSMITAEIEEMEFRVVELSPRGTRVLNRDLWILFLACCEARIPPQRHIDMTSIAIGIAIAFLLSTVTSCTITYILARTMSRRTRKY